MNGPLGNVGQLSWIKYILRKMENLHIEQERSAIKRFSLSFVHFSLQSLNLIKKTE